MNQFFRNRTALVAALIAVATLALIAGAAGPASGAPSPELTGETIHQTGDQNETQNESTDDGPETGGEIRTGAEDTAEDAAGEISQGQGQGQGDESGESEPINVDDNIMITDYRETANGMEISMEAREETAVVTVAEVVRAGDSGRMSIQQTRVSEHGATITINTETAAVTTRESIEQGHGTVVTVEEPDTATVPSAPISHGVVAGILTMVGGIAFGYRRKTNVDWAVIDNGWDQ